MTIDIRGLELTTDNTPHQARIRYYDGEHELTEDAQMLLEGLEGSAEVTQGHIDELGRGWGWAPGRTEAAVLSAIWAGRLRRD